MLWRVSVADIDRDGPFSLFPGFERQTALLSGRGFRLGDATVSAGHSTTRYSGDVERECALVAGPVRVLNVFTARDRVAGQLRWLPVGAATLVGADECDNVAVCVAGVVSFADADLNVGDSVRFGDPLTVSGTGTLVVATLLVHVAGAPIPCRIQQ